MINCRYIFRRLCRKGWQYYIVLQYGNLGAPSSILSDWTRAPAADQCGREDRYLFRLPERSASSRLHFSYCFGNCVNIEPGRRGSLQSPRRVNHMHSRTRVTEQLVRSRQ